jgi:hypothetical protein
VIGTTNRPFVSHVRNDEVLWDNNYNNKGTINSITTTNINQEYDDDDRMNLTTSQPQSSTLKHSDEHLKLVLLQEWNEILSLLV